MPGAVDALAMGMQDYPSLPEPLPDHSRRPTSGQRLLADGCYFAAYAPRELGVIYQGTLRVDSRSGQLFASGDLYAAATGPDGLTHQVGQMPPPRHGIPIFPIADYTYYLRVTKIEAAATGFALAFEANRFVAQTVVALDGNDSSQWLPQGAFTAQMLPAAAPAGHPLPALFFVGDVANADGSAIGRLQIGWVSAFLRQATIEIDCMADSEAPLSNGAGVTWDTVCQGFGWEIAVDPSDSNIKKDGSPAWTRAEAHTAMLAHRANSDLDTEWRYHVLAVHLIDFKDEPRGWMYDAGGSNQLPREGVLLASHYRFPADEARWGPLRGVRAGANAASYFRSAVHEIGHAMGLGHNLSGTSFMRPTDGIADSATAEVPFPANITWSYAPEDEHRLRHWPDIIVRPGGAALNAGAISPLGA